ncbi:hypothetical protein Bca4012_072734 [Brassica carinata]
MEQFPILSLPPEVQGLVIKRVAHNSFEDLFRLRATCKAMRSLADDEDVYALFDLFKYPWRLNGFRLRYLLRRCYAQGNPSTLYIKGIEYFYRRNMGFSRDYVAKIGLLVRSSAGLWNWDHNDYLHIRRHVFISTVAPIFYSCPSSPLLEGHWALWDIDNRKAEDMCNRCFWIKEVGLFLRDFKASSGHPN